MEIRNDKSQYNCSIPLNYTNIYSDIYIYITMHHVVNTSNYIKASRFEQKTYSSLIHRVRKSHHKYRAAAKEHNIGSHISFQNTKVMFYSQKIFEEKCGRKKIKRKSRRKIKINLK